MFVLVHGMMFDFFRKRARSKAHPQVRELQALSSCLVAWRRACLEGNFQDRTGEASRLAERLDSLRWYAQAAGSADPLADHVLSLGLGELDQGAFLEALYRIETATSVAWALGLVDAIPPVEQRADWAAMDALFPLDGPPAPSISEARLRPTDLLAKALEEWKSKTVLARKKRDALPSSEAAGIEFSRAFERARGLAWVLGDVAYIENTVTDL